MTSKVTSSSAALPARRRRDSSDDFGAAGSLGSIGGSAVGSSVASTASTKPKGALSTPSSKPAAVISAAAPTPTVHNKTSALRKRSHDEAASAASSSTNHNPSNSKAAGKGSGNTNPTHSPPLSRRPFRKRKGSVDFSLSLDSDHLGSPHQTHHDATNRAITSIVHVDALPSMDNLPDMDAPHSPTRIRSLSFASGLLSTGGTSLEKLDVLEGEAQEAAAKIKVENHHHRSKSRRKRTPSDHTKDSSKDSSQGTFTSQSHRFLLEAFMGDADDTMGGAGGNLGVPGNHDHTTKKDNHHHHDNDDVDIDDDGGDESLVDSQAAEKAEADEFRRERLGSFDTVRDRLGSFDVRDRIGSMDMRDRIGSMDLRERGSSMETRDRGDSGGASFGGRRERLESWGGMSDLSIPVHDSSQTDSLLGGGGTSTAAALAATIYNNLANDLTAIANADGNESISSFLVSDEKVPSKISTTRDRINSIASAATDPTYLQIPSEAEIPSDIQKYVKAAMATVGDQLAGMAVAATAPAKEVEDQSELSSTASPMIGAVSDGGSRAGSLTGRPRSSSLGGAMEIAVDYDAVNAALNAADAAAGAIDLAAFAQTASVSSSVSVSSRKAGKRKRHQLPTRTTKGGIGSSSQRKDPPRRPQHIELPPIPKSKLDERDMEMIRERARAAAGYVPPSKQSPGSKPLLPLKKKAKIDNPTTPGLKPTPAYTTPKSTGTSLKSMASTPYTPALSTPGSLKTPASKGQSSQKWDSMFDCLLQFIEDRRKEEFRDYPEKEKKGKWIWDGNVPTTYKTRDGKALGRWVNNQRSAKSKGVLKEDREKRLVDAGLKWSVLASNSWNEMLEELRIYVAEQTKAGRKWDGNVPTNYRIKTKSSSSKDDEDKNLGRWVNRQRSLYQAGKLRKDRQLALEKVGLKWSMLATTSWESMFETLCEYVAAKTKDGGEWDGNVPANYRTLDTPPRALGRWINRQRSAYGKDKLKMEYIQKLNKIGLKWSVHERRPVAATPDSVSSAASSSPAISTLSKSPAMNGEKRNGIKPLPPIAEVQVSSTTKGSGTAASVNPDVAVICGSSATSSVSLPNTSATVEVASSAKALATNAASQSVPLTENSAHQSTKTACEEAAPQLTQTTVKPAIPDQALSHATIATKVAIDQVSATTSTATPPSGLPAKSAPDPTVQSIAPVVTSTQEVVALAVVAVDTANSSSTDPAKMSTSITESSPVPNASTVSGTTMETSGPTPSGASLEMTTSTVAPDPPVTAAASTHASDPPADSAAAPAV